MLCVFLWLFLLSHAHACNIQGIVYVKPQRPRCKLTDKNITSSFTDFLFPRTLTIVETYAFLGTDCSTPVTVLQTVIAGGTAFYAIQQQITSQPVPLAITFQYPSLTMTQLASGGRTIDWVTITSRSQTVDERLKVGLAAAAVVGRIRSYLFLSETLDVRIVLPSQTFPTTSVSPSRLSDV
jgi:hypothetical protein